MCLPIKWEAFLLTPNLVLTENARNQCKKCSVMNITFEKIEEGNYKFLHITIA